MKRILKYSNQRSLNSLTHKQLNYITFKFLKRYKFQSQTGKNLKKKSSNRLQSSLMTMD